MRSKEGSMEPDEVEEIPALVPAIEDSFRRVNSQYSLRWQYLHRRGDGDKDMPGTDHLVLQSPEANSYICFGAFQQYTKKGFVGVSLDIPARATIRNTNSPGARRDFLLRSAKIWYDTLLNPKTCPWPGMAECSIPSYDADGLPTSVVITNSHVPATLLINYMIALRTPFYNHGGDHFLSSFGLMVANGLTPEEAWLALSAVCLRPKKTDWETGKFDEEADIVYTHRAAADYFLNWLHTDPARFFKKNPHLSGGLAVNAANGIPNNLIWHTLHNEYLLASPMRQSNPGVVPMEKQLMTRTTVFGHTSENLRVSSPMKILPLIVKRAWQIADRVPAENWIKYNQLGEIV